MKITGNPTILGSENCNVIEHVKTNCNDQSDYTVTKLDFINDDTLMLYQNPRNIVPLRIPKFKEYNESISGLLLNKVETSFIINTSNGLGGGGDLKGSNITLTLKPNDEHINLDKNGFYIKKFTEVDTSGTVPSPLIKDNKHCLLSNGTWTLLSQINYVSEIDRNTGFPNPDTLVKGMIYKIANLGSPTTTINNPYDEESYESEDVLLWNNSSWVVIGKANTRVNLTSILNTDSIIISNTAGTGIELIPATSQKAGLLSSSDKDAIHTFKGIKSLNSIVTSDTGLFLEYTERNLESKQEVTKSILIPLATNLTNGLLSIADKTKLENIPTISTKSSIDYIENKLSLINTETNLNLGTININNIPFPVASYTDDNFKNGLISGENIKKLEGISGMITLIGKQYNMEQLRITFDKYNSNTRDLISDYIELPVATKDRNGLLSNIDKIKLDSLVLSKQKQSDFNIIDPEDVSFIKNKPMALNQSGSEYSLIPSTIGLSNKQTKFLNANGDWVDSTLSKPIITVSSTEPTDPSLRIDGAIWIQTL